MDTTLTKFRAWEVLKRSRRLPVSAVCEDSATAARVDEYCRGLSRELGRGCEVTEEKWPISELRMPQLRAIAADEAAQAALIIISVHHGQSLPDEVKGWIELWLKRKGNHPVALLALFDPACQGDSTSMVLYLKNVAKRANLEFVVESVETPEDWKD